MRDLTIAVRRLAAAPFFTAFSVVTLALGIGVTTAVYSFLYATVWRGTTVPSPGDVLLVTQQAGYSTHFSRPEVQDLAAQQTVFADVAGWHWITASIAGFGTSALVRGESVTGGFFDVLQYQALNGRVLQDADDAPGAAPVIVVAEHLWQRLFGANPAVVGGMVRIAGTPVTVVGVVPAEVSQWHPRARPADFWIPSAVAPRLGISRQFDTGARSFRTFDVVGRLRADATIDAAMTELAVIGERLESASPLDRELHQRRRVHAESMAAPRRSASESEMGRLIIALPALVLLIACTNLANLALSRGTSRRHELAVRVALGASRWRLIRGHLIEGGLVAVVGGLAGILVARAAIAAATATLDTAFGGGDVAAVAFSFEWPVFAAAGVAAAGALIVSTLIPSVHLTRTRVRSALAGDTPAGALPRWRGRSNLIALQVAASVGLFLIAALCVRAIASERTRQSFEDWSRLVMASIPFDRQDGDDQRVRARLAAIVDAARLSPAIRRIGVSSALGGTMSNSALMAMQLTAAETPFSPRHEGAGAVALVATPEVFPLLNLTLRSGRLFDASDTAAAPLVAVISADLASDVFGTDAAAGRDLLVRRSVDRQGRYLRAPIVERVTVAGVVDRGIDSRGFESSVIYLPFEQQIENDISIVAAAADGDVARGAAALQQIIRDTDPDLATAFVGPGAMAMARARQARVLAAITGVAFGLAILALVLSMAGLYGVLAHVVGRRTRELGLRMALGASRPQIVRLVLRDGFRPVVEGAVIGFGTAVVLGLWLKSMFSDIEVTAVDPVAIAIGIGPLLIAATIACYLPARRAARVDPNVALREL